VISAAREPGERAKIAVYSSDRDVDPVGACVGMRGSRVQNVVQELRGERIDIIPWTQDQAKYVCNALAPAKISKVYIDEENRHIEVVVADDQLSLAIGKKGQNVRLASKLTGWKIEIKSESKMEKLSIEVLERFKNIPNLGDVASRILYNEGFRSLDDLAESSSDQLAKILKIDQEKAAEIIQEANRLRAEAPPSSGESVEGSQEPSQPAADASSEPA